MNTSTRFTRTNRSFFTRQFLPLPVLLYGLLVFTGCSTSNNSQTLAPPPPDYVLLQSEKMANSKDLSVRQISMIEPAAGEVYQILPSHVSMLYPAYGPDGVRVVGSEKAALAREASNPNCRVKDRFDRKSVIAYQWGRNRVGLHVKGLNMDGADIEQMKLEYKLQLHPEKNRKQKCLYDSSWQGLLGSSYNELFVREDETVWQELRDLRKDVE